MAQLLLLQPICPWVVAQPSWLEVEPQAVGIEADAEIGQFPSTGVGRRFESRIVLGPHRVRHQVDFTRRETQDFGILVRNDFDRQPIQVG